MKKDEELRDPNSCFNRAKDDEIIFVLLERDASAPDTIRDWCRCRIVSGKNKAQDRDILDAYHAAEQMEKASRWTRFYSTPIRVEDMGPRIPPKITSDGREEGLAD